MSSKYFIHMESNKLQAVVACGIGLAGVYYLIKVAENSQHAANLQKQNALTILRKKRQEDSEKHFSELEAQYSLMDSYERIKIISMKFEDLVEKLQRRDLTAKEVLEAYVAKALVVNREFNCITEFIPNCFEIAEELDNLTTIKGPLHGVPICVKEDHDIIGMDSTLGLSNQLYKPKTENTAIVKILMEAGAIPFCKTNLPQTTMSGGSENPIYGVTLNPLNKSLSPGGSSSGTGCLVGAGGAHFGLGSDIGGSVRIPAHFCGISTLRSTSGRLTGKGFTGIVEVIPGVQCVTGILASTAKTLSAVYEIVTKDDTQSKFDPTTVPIPWRSEIYSSKKPLKIGYFTSSPVFPALGDTPGTILNAKAALESLGHTLVPFELPEQLRLYQIGYGRTFPWSWILKWIAPHLQKFVSKRLFLDPTVEQTSVLLNYLEEQKSLRQLVLDKMEEAGLDLILCPVAPTPAVPLDYADRIPGILAYVCFWNFLDFPAGVVPFGKESCSKVDEFNDEGDAYLKMAKTEYRRAKGMPIGVQIAGRPFQEEMVLRVLTELESCQSSNPENNFSA